MSLIPPGLLAVCLSPLSNLRLAAQSAVDVVHHTSFAAINGAAAPCEATLRLAGDRKQLSVRMGGAAAMDGSLELWELRRPRHHHGLLPHSTGGDRHVVVIVEAPRPGSPLNGCSATFDLEHSNTVRGTIGEDCLRALGLEIVVDACIDGLLPARADTRAQLPLISRSVAAPWGTTPRQRRARPRVCKSKCSTGAFSTRRDLTAHVWALQRQQVFSNVSAIARACETTPDVVKSIIMDREGFDSYLRTGSLLG